MEPFSREIQEHQFSSAMRGYGRVEVDAFLTECAGHMGALEERLRITEVRAARSEEELAGLRAEIDGLLQDAMEARRTIIEKAKAEAMAIVSEAETAASLRLMEVERLRGAAEDMDANSMREETESIRASMEAQLAEIRRILDTARSGTIDLDDLTKVGVSSGPDPDVVIDLRDETTTTAPRHTAGGRSTQA